MAEEGGQDAGKLVWPLEWAGNEQSVPGRPAPWEPRCSHLQNGYDTPSGGLAYGNTRKLLSASVCVLSKVPQPFSSVSVLQAHVCRYAWQHEYADACGDPRLMPNVILDLPPPYVLRCIPLLSLGLINSATLASWGAPMPTEHLQECWGCEPCSSRLCSKCFYLLNHLAGKWEQEQGREMAHLKTGKVMKKSPSN